jgi:hypothetical protein
VRGGKVNLSETTPQPLGSVTPTWYCHRDPDPGGPPPPDCHAAVRVDESDRESAQQLLLIVLGASGSAGLIGAGAGLRRFLMPWNGAEP